MITSLSKKKGKVKEKGEKGKKGKEKKEKEKNGKKRGKREGKDWFLAHTGKYAKPFWGKKSYLFPRGKEYHIFSPREKKVIYFPHIVCIRKICIAFFWGKNIIFIP